ncbi:hypothetical protein A1O3_00196 [Capronia epimyces CBS 606.96]|uniref:Uncharacterized protein n=1 Tax=Capronia epimyces CBS 606.96 TaxID=1182542 RepID=W9YQV5_9EURO|nr:uncharacterized protein A1O3_00196 [Capronia epimyces CBS 606.96]EXJ91646.1 hypothetical protein A1O3_00196 [Capronia epimyces CBS 606.96]
MSASTNGETLPQSGSEVTDKGKGKGKAVEQPDVGEEEDDSEEESAAEEVNPQYNGRHLICADVLLATATRS